ncbi:MAG: hypothetical protein B6244_10780 [Candidatus Cloacimonetes bacterium 4572_55]|nr:MAG: hypothetical protein B6244_10780 [Candidatus Cloacimonetes bacterium 4572_55]
MHTTLPKEHYSISLIRVRYAETDAMGIVHHASYLPWFEVGRGDFGHKLKIPYSSVEARGFHFPLTEAFCRYKNASRYDDELQVFTWISKVRSRSIRFEYEIYRKDGLPIASGYTQHVVVRKDGRIVKMPSDIYKVYQRYDASLIS